MVPSSTCQMSTESQNSMSGNWKQNTTIVFKISPEEYKCTRFGDGILNEQWKKLPPVHRIRYVSNMHNHHSLVSNPRTQNNKHNIYASSTVFRSWQVVVAIGLALSYCATCFWTNPRPISFAMSLQNPDRGHFVWLSCCKCSTQRNTTSNLSYAK